MRSRSFATVFGLAVFVIGLVGVYIGVTRGSDERALARHGVVVQGTVTDKRIDHVTRRRSRGGLSEETLYVVHYRFATRQGAGLDGEQPVSEALWRRLQRGAPIAVRYAENDPFVNRVDAERGTGTNIFLLAGSLLAVTAFIFLVARIHRKRRTATPAL